MAHWLGDNRDVSDADTGPAAAGADLGWRLSTAVVLFHEAVGQRLDCGRSTTARSG